MGLRAKWVNWIKRCITTSFLVMINGSPKGFFNSTRGLRQGDPISPYLFVIGMEVFSTLIDKAALGVSLSGFNLVNRGGEEMLITHQFFSDDTLVFCNNSREQLAHLSWILYGLKPSLIRKSTWKKAQSYRIGMWRI